MSEQLGASRGSGRRCLFWGSTVVFVKVPEKHNNQRPFGLKCSKLSSSEVNQAPALSHHVFSKVLHAFDLGLQSAGGSQVVRSG